MNEIEISAAEADALEREDANTRKGIDAFLARTGAKSAEALVMLDPPVSDVDAD